MRVMFYRAMQLLCCVACLASFVWFCLVMYDMSCGRPPAYWPLRAGIALAACIGLLKLEEICCEEVDYENEKSKGGDLPL